MLNNQEVSPRPVRFNDVMQYLETLMFRCNKPIEGGPDGLDIRGVLADEAGRRTLRCLASPPDNSPGPDNSQGNRISDWVGKRIWNSDFRRRGLRQHACASSDNVQTFRDFSGGSENVALLGMSRNPERFGSYGNQEIFRPFSVSASVYSMVLLNVKATVAAGALFPPKQFWEDIEFNHLCENIGLTTIKCNTVFHFKEHHASGQARETIEPPTFKLSRTQGPIWGGTTVDISWKESHSGQSIVAVEIDGCQATIIPVPEEIATGAIASTSESVIWRFRTNQDNRLWNDWPANLDELVPCDMRVKVSFRNNAHEEISSTELSSSYSYTLLHEWRAEDQEHLTLDTSDVCLGRIGGEWHWPMLLITAPVCDASKALKLLVMEVQATLPTARWVFPLGNNFEVSIDTRRNFAKFSGVPDARCISVNFEPFHLTPADAGPQVLTYFHPADSRLNHYVNDLKSLVDWQLLKPSTGDHAVVLSYTSLMRLCAEQKVAQEMSSVSFDDLKEVISGPTPEFQTSLEKREVKVKVKRVCCTKGSGFAAVVVYIEIIGPTQDETRQSAMEDVRAGVDRPNGGQAGSQDPPAKDAQPVRTQEQNNGNGGERIPFRGLTNDPDENLCYINSVMQVLARTEPFASFCLQRQHEHDKRSKEQACAEHIRLAHKQQDSSVFRSPVAAHAFLARNESKKKPWPHYFPKGTQQDADEFFTWLLTSKVGAKFNTRVDAEFDALVTEAQADDEFYDVVKETFYFEVFNRRTCKTCTHVDNTPEIMQKLNLSIVNENVHSIKQALDAYMACAELITDYTCETCRLLSPQSKTYVLREVPKIFTLQLERFDSTRRKVSKNIAIDERLELQTDTGTSKVKFELFAIIVHRGATLDQGHYVTYLRDFGNDASKVDKLSSQSKWYLLNDAIVTLVDWDQAVKSEDIQRGAYMLFYRRTERRDVAGAGIRQTSTVLPPTPQKQIQQSVTKGISMEVEGQPEKQQQPERMGNQEQQKESKKRKEREIAQSQVNVQEEAAAGAAGAQATSASRSHPRHKITVKDSDCPTCKHTWKAGKGTNLQVSNAKKNCKANGRRCITVKFKLQVTQSATKVNSTDVEGGPDKQLQKKARGHVKDNRAGGKVQTGKRGAAGAGADADAATVSKEDRRKEKRKANRALPVGDKKCNNCHHTWKAGLLNKGEFDYAQSSCRHGRSCVEQEKGRVPKTVQRDAKDEKGPESRAPVDKRRGKDGSQTARGGATEASIDDDDEQGTDEEATEESDVDYDPPSSSRSKKRVEPKSTQAASAARRARVERQEATARLPMAERSRPTANSRKPQRGSREYNQDASAPPRKGNKEEEEAVAAAMAATAPGGTSSPRGMGGFSSDSSDF